MSDVALNLAEIKQCVSAACQRAGREDSEVELIAVSKTFPAEAVRDAMAAGHRSFGENKWQEAEGKIDQLPGHLQWHFLGGVQRNKVRKILPCFEVIHAIDSLRLAAYMDEIATELGLFPKVFLQVNVGGEASKGGFEPDVIRSEIDELLRLKRLEIIGLMCIPPAEKHAESARHWFADLRNLRDALVHQSGVPLPNLSMGMSSDFEVAIEEGATHVRVGTAIFGQRARLEPF